MANDLSINPLNLNKPLLGFRFGVFFLDGILLKYPLDFRFQSVSGISVEATVENKGGSGRAVSADLLPEKLVYPNLVLKRGKPIASTLSLDIHSSLNSFSFTPVNILLSILDENAIPLKSFIFSDAIVVKWSLSGLDASTDAILVEEIELAYKSFKPFIL